MKKIMPLMLGLALAIGSTTAFAQDTKDTTKTAKAKKVKKAKKTTEQK